jgi:hypothetical protein
MKRSLLICFFAVIASFVNAQKIYFVYLQTERGEPFFVRMNDKLYSSTESGYLILPKLKDSTYSFKLGFPGKSVDLDFSTSINKKDHGYLVKNFGEKGWGLFDLQSLSIQMSSSNMKGTAQVNASNSPVNAFTDLLAKAADDPSLKQSPILVKEQEQKPQVVEAVVKEQKKPDVTEALAKEEKKPDVVSESTPKPDEKKIDNSADQKVTAEKTPTVKTEELYKRSLVTRISGTATAEGFESVFVDEYQNGSKDTIRILIAAEKETIIAKEETKPDSAEGNKKFLDIVPDNEQVISKPQPETKKDEAKKWWPFNKNKDAESKRTQSDVKRDTHKTPLFKRNKNETATQPQPKAKDEESKKGGLFSKKKAVTETKKCSTVASNDDFLRLRRKMAAKTNDDGMLAEAKKYFKEKCFTTEQIKNLSSMFLSNAGKYNFFEAAHNFISDEDKFPSLQAELKDEYYINRFKAMVGN